MDVVAYLRVSTQAQAEDGLGLEAQQRAIRRWCRDEGHRIVAWASDEGRSGDADEIDRPGLSTALAQAENGAAEAIVVYRLDRLARRLWRQELVIHQLRKSGRVVLSVHEDDVDSDDPTKTLMRHMLGAFAEYERSLIRGRLLGGRHAKAARGGYAGFGSPPYGWRAIDKELVPDPEEQRGISLMAQWRAGGLSLRRIAARLDAEGYPPKRGERWSPMSVNRVLLRADATLTVPAPYETSTP
jgi:site-specific DNA recombinase